MSSARPAGPGEKLDYTEKILKLFRLCQAKIKDKGEGESSEWKIIKNMILRPNIYMSEKEKYEALEHYANSIGISTSESKFSAPATPAANSDEDKLDFEKEWDYQVSIRMLDGKVLTLYAKTSDTVNILKQKIFQKENIPIGQQKLIFAGKALEVDGRTLEDYKFQKESAVHLVITPSIHLHLKKLQKKTEIINNIGAKLPPPPLLDIVSDYLQINRHYEYSETADLITPFTKAIAKANHLLESKSAARIDEAPPIPGTIADMAQFLLEAKQEKSLFDLQSNERQLYIQNLYDRITTSRFDREIKAEATLSEMVNFSKLEYLIEKSFLILQTDIFKKFSQPFIRDNKESFYRAFQNVQSSPEAQQGVIKDVFVTITAHFNSILTSSRFSSKEKRKLALEAVNFLEDFQKRCGIEMLSTEKSLLGPLKVLAEQEILINELGKIKQEIDDIEKNRAQTPSWFQIESASQPIDDLQRAFADFNSERMSLEKVVDIYGIVKKHVETCPLHLQMNKFHIQLKGILDKIAKMNLNCLKARTAGPASPKP